MRELGKATLWGILLRLAFVHGHHTPEVNDAGVIQSAQHGSLSVHLHKAEGRIMLGQAGTMQQHSRGSMQDDWPQYGPTHSPPASYIHLD
jgi:hypothetical protein